MPERVAGRLGLARQDRDATERPVQVGGELVQRDVERLARSAAAVGGIGQSAQQLRARMLARERRDVLGRLAVRVLEPVRVAAQHAGHGLERMREPDQFAARHFARRLAGIATRDRIGARGESLQRRAHRSRERGAEHCRQRQCGQHDPGRAPAGGFERRVEVLVVRHDDQHRGGIRRQRLCPHVAAVAHARPRRRAGLGSKPAGVARGRGERRIGRADRGLHARAVHECDVGLVRIGDAIELVVLEPALSHGDARDAIARQPARYREPHAVPVRPDERLRRVAGVEQAALDVIRGRSSGLQRTQGRTGGRRIGREDLALQLREIAVDLRLYGKTRALRLVAQLVFEHCVHRARVHQVIDDDRGSGHQHQQADQPRPDRQAIEYRRRRAHRSSGSSGISRTGIDGHGPGDSRTSAGP